MKLTTRRAFLKTSGIGAAASAMAVAGPAPTAHGAAERITIGLIGCGGRGRGLAKSFADQKNVHVAYVCDPDAKRRAQAKKDTGADHDVADMRKVLSDKSVDAVIVATTDHWHGPATILACEAGKHVYVEKPCSHNIREGRLMVEAARRNKRVIQIGTQSRSSPQIQEAMALLAEGAIGDVLVAKATNSQRRANIGHAQPSDPPAHLDYDLWVGPAPMRPYQSNLLHYKWHWFFAFGTGDIGNDGVHDLDIARWGLGVQGNPSGASGWAHKMFFDDDQQFPDTYYVTFSYPGDGNVGSRRLLVFEQRDWSPYRQEGHENGNMFYGTKGMMILGKGGGYQIFGERNKLIKEETFGLPTDPHVRNFLDAITGGAKPNADIETGHYAATLAHLGNIVGRVGRSVVFDPKTERITGDAEADALTRRTYRHGHWAVPKGV
jgi:predicted dehydrogenase